MEKEKSNNSYMSHKERMARAELDLYKELLNLIEDKCDTNMSNNMLDMFVQLKKHIAIQTLRVNGIARSSIVQIINEIQPYGINFRPIPEITQTYPFIDASILVKSIPKSIKNLDNWDYYFEINITSPSYRANQDLLNEFAKYEPDYISGNKNILAWKIENMDKIFLQIPQIIDKCYPTNQEEQIEAEINKLQSKIKELKQTKSKLKSKKTKTLL